MDLHDFPEDVDISPRNEYPDPEYTPRFPWLGEGSGEHLTEDQDTLYSSGPIEGHTTPTWTSNESICRSRSKQSLCERLDDTEYELREDSSISDYYISDAEYDSPVPDARLLPTFSRSDSQRESSRGLKARASRSGRGGKGAKKGQRKPLEPNQEFKTLHSQATFAFIDHDYDKAEDYIQKAILNNPEMFTAHSLLSEIHLARGDKDKALLALFHGAHTRPRDINVWTNVANLILEREGDNRPSAIRDAIYCFNRVIGVDPAQVEVRFRRANLYLELGQRGKAVWEFERLLKLLPHDTKVLRHIAELYTELGDTERAIIHYDKSITYYKSLEPDVVTRFTWSDVNVYAELMSYSEPSMQGISKLKSLFRWMLGRKEDDYWDQHNDDDREFDAFDDPRRKAVPGFVSYRYELSAYGAGLPLELRVKLGILRLMLGQDEIEEAMRHFEWLESEKDRSEGILHEYFDLFRDAANALRSRSHFNEALRFYEPLQHVDHFIDSSSYGELAFCYEGLGLHDQAEECYRTILQNDEGNVNAGIRLIRLLENANLPHRASPYLAKILSTSSQESKSRRNCTFVASVLPADVQTSMAADFEESLESAGISTMLEPPQPPKASKKPASKKRAQEVEIQENLRMLFLQMQGLKGKVYDQYCSAKDEWMRTASILFARFRKNRTFFGCDRFRKTFGVPEEAKFRTKGPEAIEMVEETHDSANIPSDEDKDIELSIPSQYCGIAFDDWLDMFLEYALLVALNGDLRLAYEIVTVATDAHVFNHSSGSAFRIHVCWFTCALLGNDSETLCNVARYFMKELQSFTDSYRLFATLNRMYDGPSSFYNSGPSQKYILRQVKAMDLCLIENQQPSASCQERASYTMRDGNGNPVKVEKLDIGLLMLYGYILYAGRSYSFALNYFFRAYALDPTNPMINLSLGLGYLHYALKRQSDNRHYLIVQGFSFLFIYYDYQSNSRFAIERQEAEYNMGRAYHMLGLTHLAIPYYMHCLNLNANVEEEVPGDVPENFTREAAYALQGIWATSENPELSAAITEQWLVL